MFYLALFPALNCRVDNVLIGGLTIALHGIEWATMDIDVTVATRQSRRTQGMARELGMTPVPPVPLEAVANVDQLAQWHRERNLVAFALRAPGPAGVTLDVLRYPPLDYPHMRRPRSRSRRVTSPSL